MPGDSGTAPQALARANPHFRDALIHFVESTHRYSIKRPDGSFLGRFVTSVTPTVHGRFAKFDPDKTLQTYWARWQRDRTHKYHGLAPNLIKLQWLDAGREASRLGTLLHEAIERHLNGDPPEPSAEIAQEWTMYLAYRKTTTWTPHRTEMLIWDLQSRICGSIDALVKNRDGSFSIVDWKRSKHDLSPNANHWGRFGSGPFQGIPDTPFHKYSLQLSAYRCVLEKRYGIRIRSCLLVQMHPEANEGAVKVIECADYRNEMTATFRRRAATIRRLERLRRVVWAIAFVGFLGWKGPM